MPRAFFFFFLVASMCAPDLAAVQGIGLADVFRIRMTELVWGEVVKLVRGLRSSAAAEKTRLLRTGNHRRRGCVRLRPFIARFLGDDGDGSSPKGSMLLFNAARALGSLLSWAG